MKHLKLGVEPVTTNLVETANQVGEPVEVESFTPPAPTQIRSTTMTHKTTLLLVVASVAIVLSGTATGYVAARATKPPATIIADTTNVESDSIAVGSVFGSNDTDTFTDDAQGVVLIGGFEGEGSHRLLRPGGSDQTVYLTSSVVDLNLFSNHKVKVQGQTFAGQKTSWLMDVGRVEVLELNAPLPFDEDE